ncbi:11351_t:CDS:2, partial [Dentiscutata heterogama]
ENKLLKQIELLNKNDKNRKHPNNDCIEQENLKFYKIDETDDNVKMNDSNDNDHDQIKNLLNELRSSENMKNLVDCF